MRDKKGKEKKERNGLGEEEDGRDREEGRLKDGESRRRAEGRAR